MEIDYSKFFPIKGYYEKVVMPLNNKYRYTKKDKFVCCLHDDTDPSLGIIMSKSKGEIFHCFGCNSWGNILDLHKRVSLKFFNKRIDDELCKRELCNIFGIDYASLPKDEYIVENIRDKDVRKELAMREALHRYDISDFRNSLIEGKMQGKGIEYFNSNLIRIMCELKKD